MLAGRRRLSHTTRKRRGVLYVTLRSATQTVLVRIVHPAISISGSEATRVRGKKVKTLLVTIAATNTLGKRSTRRIHVKVG